MIVALKYKVESVDGLDESVASLYQKTDDGYVLQVEGVVDKSKLDEFRDNNIDLMKKLKEFDGVDVEKYKTLVADFTKRKDQKLIEEGKVDELVAERIKAVKDASTQEIEALSGKLGAANKQLENLLIDNAVRDAAI